jgi:drug/metabolite transporter (DMT)-like permease
VTGVLFVVFASFLWALDTLIRYPLVEKGIDPIVIVFFEHALLTLLFLPKIFIGAQRIGELKMSDAFSFLVVGGAGSAIATVAFTMAFMYLNPSLVILLQKFQPVVAILLAWVVLKEPIPRPFLFWGLVCLIGALLVSAPDIEKVWLLLRTDPDRLASHAALRGYALVSVSVLGWGASTVFGKKLSLAGFEPSALSTGRFFVGFVVLLFFVPFGQSLIFADPSDYLRLSVMVMLSGALAVWLYYQGLKRLPAKFTTIIEMFFPLCAVVVNWVFLGKQLSEIQLLGGAILVFGALILQLKKY